MHNWSGMFTVKYELNPFILYAQITCFKVLLTKHIIMLYSTRKLAMYDPTTIGPQSLKFICLFFPWNPAKVAKQLSLLQMADTLEQSIPNASPWKPRLPTKRKKKNGSARKLPLQNEIIIKTIINIIIKVSNLFSFYLTTSNISKLQ